MRILQLNAWTLRLPVRIEDMIHQEAPDIVMMQEALECQYDIGFFSTLGDILENVHFHHRYFSPVYGLQFVGRQAQFGNAILSNLAFSDQQTVFTNHEYTENFTFETQDYNVRNFQHVIVRDQNDAPIHIINHHGYHIPGHKRGNEFTLKACRQITDYAEKLEGPIIITGDFNLEPGSESIAVLNERFRNLSQEYGLETTRTDLTHKTEVCDYIFVNDQVKVNGFYVSSVVASDHQGLVLDFEVS